jgi:predicted GIY-YIG superfamily endonuclease
MTIYLLHFSRKLSGHAKHYIGSAENLEGRLWHHRHGSGACITRAAVRQGIKLMLARTWQAERSFEGKLKRQKHARRYCPLCNRSRRPH